MNKTLEVLKTFVIGAVVGLSMTVGIIGGMLWLLFLGEEHPEYKPIIGGVFLVVLGVPLAIKLIVDLYSLGVDLRGKGG